ncbi:signal peptidase I [Pontivivens insulae]|uniref:Signal peptidase I n=1 Tax=Pontivivens insulae TaxID=1639689 RepID=A0A2R8ADA8_9RHOB|nr:signal peptidase I [Pontivivens insulae]RED14172.1 signal peptidase I [Pontivivens insulae]SPF30247.1 Signal peptidase I [Pontivivens insulae]
MAKEAEGGFLDTLKTIFWALLIAGVLRTLLFQPFYIPSGSMKPTLLIGDFLFVNKFAYGYSAHSCPTSRMCPFSGRIFGSEPERGDIVVFAHPETNVDYIKRVIGLPGDTISMSNGQIILNGEPLSQTPDGVFTELRIAQRGGQPPSCSNGVVALGAECEKAQFVETIPEGPDHLILDTGPRGFDNTGTYTVPEGHFFFMGDNRDNSVDSRFFSRSQFNEFRANLDGEIESAPGGVGFVPFENLIGRANFVLFSSGGSSMFAFWTWRADRFFEWVE